MPKRVNRYETSDGLLLETLEDARAHESWLELVELITRRMPQCQELTHESDCSTQTAWLIANRDALIPLLKAAERHDAKS